MLSNVSDFLDVGYNMNEVMSLIGTYITDNALKNKNLSILIFIF